MPINKKGYAVGHFILACLHLSEKRGGKQKVQRIVGKRIFYESDFKGKWMFANPVIAKLSISKLKKLTDKVENA